MFKWNYDFTSRFVGEAAIMPELCLVPHHGCGWGVPHNGIYIDTARVSRGSGAPVGTADGAPALSRAVGRVSSPSTAGARGDTWVPPTLLTLRSCHQFAWETLQIFASVSLIAKKEG